MGPIWIQMLTGTAHKVCRVAMAYENGWPETSVLTGALSQRLDMHAEAPTCQANTVGRANSFVLSYIGFMIRHVCPFMNSETTGTAANWHNDTCPGGPTTIHCTSVETQYVHLAGVGAGSYSEMMLALA